MKLASAAVALLSSTLPVVTVAQECLLGSFTLEFDGECTAAKVLETYTEQVYEAAGATATSCTTSAEDDLNAKLAAAGIADASELCDQVYATQHKVPFTAAANRGTDLHFEQMFYNGRTDWQEEVETLYEESDFSATSILREDAEQVRSFYDGVAQGYRVDWPGALPNFKSSVNDADNLATCTTNAAMCCWPKDRQANDGNGNCAMPYDTNCVNKDPADNTNLCYVDVERGNSSTGEDGKGFIAFPGDNNDGEGSIHCHGLAWSNDVNDRTARYKANNLFFVSMYDHMYQRGYVKNIPGAPMCGCVEQMPTVSRSDCTQVDLTETVSISYDADADTFDSKLTQVYIDFNACQGINNRNNDLWAYIAKLYYQKDVTKEQFGEAGRIITDKACVETDLYHLNTNLDLSRGYDHDVTAWTKVAGRDDLSDGHAFGLGAFNTVFFENSLTDKPIMMRVCASCTETHKRIYYRRLNPVTGTFDLLNNILFHRNDGDGQNKWTEDFTLHSTYEDAQVGANPWGCPNNAFNYGAPFYGECSPTGDRVREQYSIFNWDHGRRDVAYYVNTPEGTGVEELDLDAPTTARFEGFTDVDLGSPSIEGKTFIMEPKNKRRALVEGEGGPIIVTGSGHDIWGEHDAGHFLSQPWSGDIDVSVHLSDFNGVVNTWAKAGIMLRSDNSNNAVHVFGFLSGGYGALLGARRSTGQYSTHGGNWYQTDPIQKSSWIRLTKIGDHVKCFFKNNEEEDWMLKGSMDLRFPEDTYRVGLAVTSHHNSYVSEVIFEDFSVEQYNSPTFSPTISSAPTVWEPLIEIGGGRAGTLTYYQDSDISKYRAYGTGIWGTSDSFFYDNRQKQLDDGAFDVITYIKYFHTGYEWAKGGIMIRDTNDPDSAHAFLGVRGNYVGVTFQTRATAGATTDHHQTNFVPNHKTWIRLSKPADSGTITAYYKIAEADEWMEMGSADIAFTGSSVYVGTAVTPGEPSGNGSVQLETIGYEVIDATR